MYERAYIYVRISALRLPWVKGYVFNSWNWKREIVFLHLYKKTSMSKRQLNKPQVDGPVTVHEMW